MPSIGPGAGPGMGLLDCPAIAPPTGAPVAQNDASPPQLPATAEIDREIRRLALALPAAELHGSLCGWLAGGGVNARDWPARVLVDAALETPDAGSPLDRLREASAAQLGDRSFGFELLLPEADAPLAARSGALFDWCRGFLGAFGLAAGAEPTLSDESREALADLARLAAAVPQEEGDEDDEAALAEIEEFVRISALLLHSDCVLAPQHRKQFN